MISAKASGWGAVAGVALLVVTSCSDAERAPPGGVTVSGGAGAGGATASGGKGAGAMAATGGASLGAGGASAEGGSSDGASAGETNSGGSTNDAGAASIPRGGAVGSGGAPLGTGGQVNGETGGAAGSGDGEPTCPSDSAGGAAPELGSVCDPAAEWGAPMSVALTNNGTSIVAITPDELTIVYYAETSGPQTFWAADRPSADAAFDAGQDLPGLDIVALSPDGLRLITLLPGRHAFNELTRASRDGDFEAPGEGAFTTLNADADANGSVFSGCIVAPDDKSLYYSVSGSDLSQTVVRVAKRAGAGPWPLGTPLETCELRTVGPYRRLPTGISADGLTLFYFDELSRSQRAAWRASVDSDFSWFRDLGNRAQAQPNQACNRLYFSATAGPSFADPSP